MAENKFSSLASSTHTLLHSQKKALDTFFCCSLLFQSINAQYFYAGNDDKYHNGCEVEKAFGRIINRIIIWYTNRPIYDIKNGWINVWMYFVTDRRREIVYNQISYKIDR